jgi:hypothetical protein
MMVWAMATSRTWRPPFADRRHQYGEIGGDQHRVYW